MNKQTGVALILVLMLSLLLSIVAVGFQHHASTVVKRVKQQQIKTELKVVLESEKQALFYTFFSTDTLFKNRNFFKHYTLSDANIKVQVRVVSHDSKMSLFDIQRNALKQIVTPFFDSPADIDAAVDSYYDWIDSDDLRRPNGWEARDYSRAQRPGPQNGPISSIDDLALIRGFDQIPSALLSNLFTSYPTIGLDKAFASPQLLSQFFSSDIVEQILIAQTEPSYSRTVYERITGDISSDQSASGIFYLTIHFLLTKEDVVEQQAIDVKVAPYHPIPLQIFKVGLQ